jgi:predicted dehydrogenase
MFKCAFLGCGPRAKGHARAYKHVKRGTLTAICDMNEQRLNEFGDEFGVKTRYTDLHEMLDKERPDLLHVVTPPTIRHSLMSVASEHGVPAAIVEKPIAIQGEDYRDLLALSQSSQTKFMINTQLHFHPNNLELKRIVADGRIGDVKFVDGSARSTPVDQGPHVMELVTSYVNRSRPVKVFGQISGGKNLDGRQPSPDHATASITFESGVRALVTFGLEGAPKSNPSDSTYMHKRVAAYGTKGFTHWTMVGWERFTPEGGYESGSHDYGQQDELGQAGLTEAVFDWLEDEKKIHPTHLAQSLVEFNTILGLYVSAMTHAPVALPCEPPSGLIETLKGFLQ